MSITEQVASMLKADRHEHELADARDPHAPRPRHPQLPPVVLTPEQMAGADDMAGIDD